MRRVWAVFVFALWIAESSGCATVPDNVTATVMPLLASCPSISTICNNPSLLLNITSASSLNGDTCTSINDTIAVKFTIQFAACTSGSGCNSIFDIALWTAGDNGKLASGTTAQICYGYAPTVGEGDGNSDLTDCDNDKFINADTAGDTCGDVTQATGSVKMTFTSTVACAGINNQTYDLTVPVCVAWNSVSGNGASGQCSGGFNRAIAIQSKCNCPVLSFNKLIDPCLLKVCNDGFPCTTDTCSSVSGIPVCIYTFNASNTCSDNNACTINDHCVNSSTCAGTSNPPAAFDAICDRVQCNTQTGWFHNFTAVSTPCNDSLFCTATDTCDGSGHCIGSGLTSCTQLNTGCATGVCNSTLNACMSQYKASGTACGSSTSDSCTLPDTCNSVGQCLSNNVADGTVCVVATTVCSKNSTCLSGVCTFNGYQPNTLQCRPGQNCYVPVYCTGSSSSCPPYSTQLTCDDNNACTLNTCINGTSCDYSVPVVCADSTSCTTITCNTSTGCSNTSVTCIQPANQCQQTVCVEPQGCTLQNTSGNSCSSSPNLCFTSSYCSNSVCVSNTSTPVICTASTICTTYACNPNTGFCAATHHDGDSCSNDNCLTGQFCYGGSCIGGSTVNCTDAFPCTTDYCLNGTCYHDLVTNPPNDPCPALFAPPNPIGCTQRYACTGSPDCSAVYFPEGTACNGAPLPCEVQHICQSGVCAEQGWQPNNVVCNASVDGDCDLPDYCSGIDYNCISNFQPETFICRPVLEGQDCGFVEYCTGSSNYCPPDQNHSSFVVCRPARGVCDLEEHCSGFSAYCPPDQVKSIDALCDTGSTLTVDCRPPTHCSGIPGQDDCMPGPAINCNDGLGCTANSCNSTSFECSTLPVFCADPGGLCTDVTCSSSTPLISINSTATTSYACPSVSVVCDDYNTCTDDFCDADTGCYFINNSDGCDDGDFCTVFDQCSNGTCAGVPRYCDQPDQCIFYYCSSQTSSCLQDNNTLNGQTCFGSCLGAFYECLNGSCLEVIPPCDDSIACTVDSYDCDHGECMYIPDSNLCGNWTDPACGLYVCDSDVGCVVSPFTGQFCGQNISSVCDPADVCGSDGLCIQAYSPNTTACNTPAICEAQMYCDGMGQCPNATLLSGTQCYTPHLACDGPSFCNGESSSCPPPTTDVSRCPLNLNPCKAYICTANFSCVLGNAPDNTVCDDGNVCTQNDFCLSGFCRPGTQSPCDTHDFCNRSSCVASKFCTSSNTFGCTSSCVANNRCISKAVCTFTPRDCSDKVFCNGLEFCANQQCNSGVPPCTADSIACTEDFCNETTKTCMHVPNNLFCSTDPCMPAQCTLSGCVALPPLICDDDNPCTDDQCITGFGCRHTPNNTATCTDNNACTVGDKCCDGNCEPGLLRTCHDGLHCTTERCIPETGLCELLVINQTYCNDDYNCTNDYCQTHYCDDLSACLHDSDCLGIGSGMCNRQGSGCRHTDVDDCCENCYLTRNFWASNFSEFKFVVPRSSWVCFSPMANYMPEIGPLEVLLTPTPSTVWLHLMQLYYVVLADVLNLHQSDRCACLEVQQVELRGEIGNVVDVCTSYFQNSSVATCLLDSGSLLQSALPPASGMGLPSCLDYGDFFPTEFTDSVALARATECALLFQDFLSGSTGLNLCDNFETQPLLGSPFSFLGFVSPLPPTIETTPVEPQQPSPGRSTQILVYFGVGLGAQLFIMFCALSMLR